MEAKGQVNLINMFFFFKDLDPDPDWIWIRIRISIQPKMLDPDPDHLNTGLAATAHTGAAILLLLHTPTTTRVLM